MTRTGALIRALLFIFALSFICASTAGAQSVTTYHFDNYRTGWNSNEAVLTPANVNSSTFGLLLSVPLNDQVDGQPLYMPGVNITAGPNQGVHDVVYVAAESNTVYAIDAESGAVLLSPNFGTPVPMPLGCNNNGPNVGINSTPVIDPTSNTLYVMVYTLQSSAPAYLLHALDLGSLADKVAPRLVTASHTLTDGSTLNFNAKYQRQRPGLLLANGDVYAGFGSFCDYMPSLSRGWLLGWQTGTLTPLAANHLFDTLNISPNNVFLSSIWMSGFGPSTDDSGNVLVVTGNSDEASYDGTNSLQESVVKLSPDLFTVLDLFTPSDWAALDHGDGDFGSGGVLVLPDQPGSHPHLAVAAGKEGAMFLMNEDDLGGYSSVTNNVLGKYSIGRCWCGPSYFVDHDSVARVVSSGGSTVEVWKLQTTPTTLLSLVAQSGSIGGGQDPGFFTSVSSNGTNNAVIWALSRPQSKSNSAIYLYAFNPDSGATMSPLFSAQAGDWPNFTGNSNLVPVVANDEVFVASHNQLQIFGLTSSRSTTTTVLTSSSNPSNYGQSVTLTAQVTTTGSTAPTGSVTFKNGAAILGTTSLNANGSATLTNTNLPVGSDSLTATFSGDAMNRASTSSLVQVVNQATVTMSLTSSPNPSPAGKGVTFTAAFKSTGGLPTGAVTFSYAGTTLGAPVIGSTGIATISTTKLPAGSDVVSATYAGSVNYSATTMTVTQIVNATTTTLTSSLTPSNYGQSLTLTAHVTNSNSTVPTGNVTFKNGTISLGTASLNASGVATLANPNLAVGSDQLTASYGGDAQNGASTSAAITQVVNQAMITMSLTSAPNPAPAGKAVIFTATLTSTGGLPKGVVTFSLSGTTLGTATIGTNGKAAFSTTALPAGSHVVTATYAGSGDYSAATMTVTQVVNATTTGLTSSLTPSNYGQLVTLTAHVTTTGSTAPTGNVLFKNGTTSLGTVSLNASGVAILTKTNLPVGSNSLTASYNGDALNGASTSAAITQVVNQATTSLKLTSTPNPSNSGQSVTFTAVMTSNGGVPTGSVTFSFNGTTLGTSTIVGGRAMLSLTTLPVGSDQVTANYGASADYSAASASITQTVN